MVIYTLTFTNKIQAYFKAFHNLHIFNNENTEHWNGVLALLLHILEISYSYLGQETDYPD
jgi:hypothetical protein